MGSGSRFGFKSCRTREVQVVPNCGSFGSHYRDGKLLDAAAQETATATRASPSRWSWTDHNNNYLTTTTTPPPKNKASTARVGLC